MAQEGYSVSLLVCANRKEIDQGVKIVPIDKSYNSRFRRILFGTRKAYKKAMSLNADVYHIHDPELLPWGAKLNKMGKAVIYDVHEDLPRQIFSKYWIPWILRRPLAYIAEKYENSRAAKLNGIITSTPHICERFQNVNQRTIDIKNYPHLRNYHFHNNWENKKDQVCYIGAITKYRGGAEMVTAMDYLDQVNLTLGGRYSGDTFRKYLESLNGWSKTRMLGYLNRQEVAKVLSDSKVGLVTLHPIINHLDALPVKMFEYMAAGIPVVASNIPLWKQIIEEAECGICVDPLKPKEIAEAIRYLIKNEKEAEKMGKNGREMVEKEYNWQREARRLIRFYEKILAE